MAKPPDVGARFLLKHPAIQEKVQNEILHKATVMTWESTLALAGTLFIIAMIPGPGVMAVTGCALGRGSKAALAMTAGVVTGDAIYLTAAVFGLAVLAQSMGDFFLIVRLAGAAYLVWMGIKLWRAPADIPVASVSGAADQGVWRNAGAGLTVTLGNPKTMAFYLGLLPTFVELTAVNGMDYAVSMTITVVVVGGSVSFYAVAGGRLRYWMQAPHRVRVMNRTGGAIMIGTGAVLATKG